jgi:hypothetical protein
MKEDHLEDDNRWEDNIKMHSQRNEVQGCGLDLTDLGYGSSAGIFVKTVMIIWVPKKQKVS